MLGDDSLPRALARTAAMCVASGAIVGFVFTANGADFLSSWLISTTYAQLIALPSTIALRVLRPRLVGKRPAVQWLGYAGAMATAAVAGSAVTGLLLVALGLMPMHRFGVNYLFALEIAGLITVPTLFGAMSALRMRDTLTARDTALARAETSAAEARLASLESRIRPHFLFNALNSAIALIPDDPAAAEAVLERLAALLRFSLDAHVSRLVPLGEELRIVADYLEIERARFGDRLRYRVDAPGDLASVAVPAFAVQTLVENSVKYAVSARGQGAAIVVTARRAGDVLALEVRDDGPGFTGPVWRPGHGLDGLRARLAAVYGDAARLVAPAPAEAGAAVVVELPVVVAGTP